MFKKILVAYDGSKGAERALSMAIKLASEQRGELWVLSVAEHLPRYPATIAETDEALRAEEQALAPVQYKARLIAEEEGVTVQLITRAGHAGQAIIQAATEGQCDLLVLPTGCATRLLKRSSLIWCAKAVLAHGRNRKMEAPGGPPTTRLLLSGTWRSRALHIGKDFHGADFTALTGSRSRT